MKTEVTIPISKSTVAGLLSGIIGVCAGLPAIDPSHLIPIKVLGWAALIAAAARIFVGKISADPDTVKVDTPDGTKLVTGHAEPDDPTLTPKVPQ